MLIFDSFSSREDAELFVKEVTKKFQLSAKVYDSQEESDKDDIFVLVERPNPKIYDAEKIERDLEKFVDRFGGEFAGA